MLTSSEAKFRCMWHMVVWSIMLMIVSQFFRLTDHIAFYIFASAAMLLLPLITSIYSNTAGRHGAGLLRVSYIFCDPVLACLTVIPVLLINRLPVLVEAYACLEQPSTAANETHCYGNSSIVKTALRQHHRKIDSYDRSTLQDILRVEIGLIQASLVAPSLLTLAMGRRTRKMSYATIVGVACYWLVACVETADLIDLKVIAAATSRRHHAVVSAASVVAIAAILLNSYAVVTLCSYICPTDDRRGEDGATATTHRFDTLYRFLVGTGGVLFAEIPMLSTRGQVIAAAISSDSGTGPGTALPVIFYIWIVKDVMFIGVAVTTVGVYIISARHGTISSSCGRLVFDNPDVFFAPEKRDEYIVRHMSDPHNHHHHDHHNHRLPLPSHVVIVHSDGDTEDKKVAPGSDGGHSADAVTVRKKKKVTFRLDMHHSSSSGSIGERPIAMTTAATAVVAAVEVSDDDNGGDEKLRDSCV